jgi:protein-S-isoprenylcysteine O-methyltransferase Ste14
VLGWLAVAVQVAAIGGQVWSGRSAAAPPWLLGWFGALLVLCGAVVMLLAFLNLGPALTPTPVPKQASGLRQTGLYAWVRHPIYSGLLLLMLGLLIRSPTAWSAFWFAALAVVLTVKSVWEERMLTEMYPQYPEYRLRTGRFVPRWSAMRRRPLHR